MAARTLLVPPKLSASDELSDLDLMLYGVSSVEAKAVTRAYAAMTLMSPSKAPTPQASAALVATLTAQRAAHGLDADHGFAVSRQHPGEGGAQVTRIVHIYKGVRIFGSESVLVTDASGKLVSEAGSDRRLFLGKGSANRLGAATAEFGVTPALSTKAAIDAALRSLPAGATHVTPAGAELIIYPIMKTERVPAAVNKADDELNATPPTTTPTTAIPASACSSAMARFLPAWAPST